MKLFCKLFGHKYKIYHKWHIQPKEITHNIIATCDRCGKKIETSDDTSIMYLIERENRYDSKRNV